MSRRSFWTITLSLVAVKLIIHFLTATNYELHRDEMLYFSMGSHLSWGYASTPPFIASLAFTIKSLFGYQEFFVKLFPALAGGGIIILIALFIREIGGRKFAVFTGGMAYIISIAMLRSASLFMPVIFELFFWMLFLFFVLKLINTRNQEYWIAIGASFGMAFLNKYSVAFLGLATLTAFLVSDHRKLLLSKYLLYGILAGLLIMLPNLLWQFNHKFPVVTHMTELYRTQLVHVSKQTFFTEQIMMNFTSLLFWLSGLIALIFFKPEKKYRIFAWIFLFVVLLLLFTKGKPYYTLGVYPMLFAFGGYVLEKYLVGKMKIAGFLLTGFSVLLSIFFIPLGLPVLPAVQMEKYCSAFSRNISSAPMRNEQNGYYPLPQDYMDMTGWKELAGLAAVAYNELDSLEQKECILFANNYGQAGALDFYGKQYNLPVPVSLSDSYIFWAPDSIAATIFIVTDMHTGNIPELFNTYKEVGSIKNNFFREDGLKVFLCRDPKPHLKEFFKTKTREYKQKYGC
jgi:hypothetical protein